MESDAEQCGRDLWLPFSDDQAVRQTNNDALSCKRVAVMKRYWQDPYLKYFDRSMTVPSKTPEISRGYFSRVRAIFALVEKFLRLTCCDCQIINLGAGFDTLFWRLFDAGGLQAANFIETDFADVVAEKTRLIKRAEQSFVAALGGSVRFSTAPTELHSAKYHLIGADLRSVECFRQRLLSCAIDFEMPTLFVCECVLVYLPMDKCQQLLTFLAETFPRSCFVDYEMINLNDSFGHFFKQNMLQRSIVLGGGDACASVFTQQNRFLSSGWQHARVWTMAEIYKKYLPRDEVQRIEQLEPLDEPELLMQLLDHYCMVISSNEADPTMFEKLCFS